MCESNCRIGSIDTLPSSSRRAECILTYVLHIQIYSYVITLRHDNNTCSRRMYSPFILGLWNSLNPMHSRFILQVRIYILTCYSANKILISSRNSLNIVDNANLPRFTFGITTIHPK